MNPYEHLDALYSQQAMQRHAEGAEEEPHAYAVAERLYRALCQTSAAPQAVVVSGESGAGKAETNKHLVAYLRWRAASAGGTVGGSATPTEEAAGGRSHAPRKSRLARTCLRVHPCADPHPNRGHALTPIRIVATR